jgi:hypothetical protein
MPGGIAALASRPPGVPDPARSADPCHASGFFPVPLQGTQTFRCPRALMVPTPRQWGHASSSASASLDGAAILLPKVISSSFDALRDLAILEHWPIGFRRAMRKL